MVGGEIATSTDCCCGNKCIYTWESTFDCEAGVWGEPVNISTVCGTCPDSGLYWVDKEGEPCVRTRITCGTSGECEGDSIFNCESPPTGILIPAKPVAPPILLDCCGCIDTIELSSEATGIPLCQKSQIQINTGKSYSYDVKLKTLGFLYIDDWAEVNGIQMCQTYTLPVGNCTEKTAVNAGIAGGLILRENGTGSEIIITKNTPIYFTLYDTIGINRRLSGTLCVLEA